MSATRTGFGQALRALVMLIIVWVWAVVALAVERIPVHLPIRCAATLLALYILAGRLYLAVVLLAPTHAAPYVLDLE